MTKLESRRLKRYSRFSRHGPGRLTFSLAPSEGSGCHARKRDSASLVRFTSPLADEVPAGERDRSARASSKDHIR